MNIEIGDLIIWKEHSSKVIAYVEEIKEERLIWVNMHYKRGSLKGLLYKESINLITHQIYKIKKI